jgi:hypothetical protein
MPARDANVALCAAALIELGRQSHHPSLAESFAKAPPAPENPTPLAAMSHRLQTPEGKKLYALRKQIPEPVFGNLQIGDGLRSVPPAWRCPGPRRVEPRHDGLDHEADVRPGGRLKRAPAARAIPFGRAASLKWRRPSWTTTMNPLIIAAALLLSARTKPRT